MFLISKFRVYLSFIVAMIAFIVIGIHGYRTFSHLDSIDSMSLKYFAENFIFYILIIMVILTVVFVSTLVKSNNIYRELEKVIELSRQGKYSSGNQLKKLGNLGQKIIDINAHLDSLNEMKSLKISSLSNIINFLLDKAETPMLLLDAQGMIIKVSDHLIDQLKIEEREILNKYAENILDNFNYSNVMNELRKSKYVTLQSPFSLESIEKPVSVHLIIFPIFNYKNEISNCICTMVHEDDFKDLITKTTDLAESEVTEDIHELTLFKRFKDIFHKNL